MPKVLNKWKLNKESGIYIGRGSKYGNPFVIGEDGTREEVIQKYKEWFKTQNIEVDSLRGNNLICFCAPLACHGDFLLKEANG